MPTRPAARPDRRTGSRPLRRGTWSGPGPPACRSWRAACRRARPTGLAVVQPMLYLVVEHQRQAGQADDQQERRTDQAGPFVDHIPGFDGGGGGHGMGTAEGRAPSGVSVDWKRNSITNNSYSRSVLCGAGHSRALACRGRAGGRQRAVSKRVKSSLAAPCGPPPQAESVPVRHPGTPCSSLSSESLATSPAATSRWAMCMGIFPPASEPGSVGFRSGARPVVLGGRPGGPGPENEQVLDWLRQPGSTRCKAITRTTRSTTSAAARWTR